MNEWQPVDPNSPGKWSYNCVLHSEHNNSQLFAS